MPNLSRRLLVSSTAALPALALPSVALPHPSDAELERLGKRVADAWKELDEACNPVAAAETRWYAWCQLNPEASKDAENEFKEACGYFDASSGEDRANALVDEAIESICEVRARSLRGLIVKARAYEIINGTDDDIALSIVDDLLEMACGQAGV